METLIIRNYSTLEKPKKTMQKMGMEFSRVSVCLCMFSSDSRTNWIDAKELLWFADLLEMADWFTALKLGSGRGLAWYVSAVP